MNIQRKNSAHHFRMQSEREQTLARSIRINRMLARTIRMLARSIRINRMLA